MEVGEKTCLYRKSEHFVYILQRLNEARRMMDKLRACIVANYFANAGLTKVPDVSPRWSSPLRLCCCTWSTFAVLCVPAHFQKWPSCPEPPGHPTVPGVAVPLLFPPQPGLWDSFPGPVGVRIPLAAGRRGWEGRGSQRRLRKARRQTWTQHGQSGLEPPSGIFFPFLLPILHQNSTLTL